MRRPRRGIASALHRRGVVLLVVLALLALFAAVGIAFVWFADQEATSARLGLESQEESRPQPDLLWAYALNQLVFDTNNPNSALRTHSLVMNMYGPAGNMPFNGIGRRHRSDQDPSDPLLDKEDPYYYLNFQGRTFDPLIHGSPNAPYTYPDWNNAYLGAINSQGVVLARSFVRAGPQGFQPYDVSSPLYSMFWGSPTGPFGLTAALKSAMVTRPVPADEARCIPGRFPFPADAGGDVKNLPPGTPVRLPDGQLWSGNDSYWMDLGFPDQIGADGKRYRPLFAYFITDLDGRVNLNVHGNVRGSGNQHVSNMGFGPWEVNLEKVFVDANGQPTGEVPALFLGTKATPPFQTSGRYGIGVDDKSEECCANFAPGLMPMIPRMAPYYSLVDYDGCRDAPTQLATAGQLLPYQPSEMFLLPGQHGTLNYDRFPRYRLGDPPALAGPERSLGYPRGDLPWYNDRVNEFRYHPMGYSPFLPGAGNRAFGAWNMDALLRHGDTGADAMVSDLRQLLPNSMNLPALRRLVTTHSCDVNRPGAMPWNDGYTARLTLASSNPLQFVGGATPFPDKPPLTGITQVSSSYFRRTATDFTNTWQARALSNSRQCDDWIAALNGRIDLNRRLPDYPAVDRLTGRIPGESWGRFEEAQTARQDFAADLFVELLKVTGVVGAEYYYGSGDNQSLNLQASTPDVDAVRALAQIAVNIVDYIDNDDYITPFAWGRKVPMTVFVIIPPDP